jgi:hypothetical protein
MGRRLQCRSSPRRIAGPVKLVPCSEGEKRRLLSEAFINYGRPERERTEGPWKTLGFGGDGRHLPFGWRSPSGERTKGGSGVGAKRGRSLFSWRLGIDKGCTGEVESGTILRARRKAAALGLGRGVGREDWPRGEAPGRCKLDLRRPSSTRARGLRSHGVARGSRALQKLTRGAWRTESEGPSGPEEESRIAAKAVRSPG